MNLPPIIHTCCGTPCFYEDADDILPCWGNIICVDSNYYFDENPGMLDEYRTGACEAHVDMYPSYDKSKYNKPNASQK